MEKDIYSGWVLEEEGTAVAALEQSGVVAQNSVDEEGGAKQGPYDMYGPLDPPGTGQGRSIEISKKAILVAVVTILTLFIAAYILTFILPKGAYQYDGASIIPGTYAEDPSLPGIKWWQFLLSPFMILLPVSEGFATVWAIIALLLIIGAIFTALDASGVLVYMVEYLNHKFGKRKNLLLFLLPFAFMFLGSSAGMLEELIPLVPVVIMLSYALGWDALVGLGMSVLAACFGFAAGVVNPFTVGVSQTLAIAQGMDIAMYSGIEMRILSFVVAYIVLMLFLYPYAKKIAKTPKKSLVYAADQERKKRFSFRIENFEIEKNKNKALLWFGSWLLLIVVFALISIPVQALADYIMYIALIAYVAGGIGACIFCGLKGKKLAKLLGKGLITLLPAVVMIMFAGAIRYIVEQGDIMPTILHAAENLIARVGDKPFVIVLIIYMLIIVFNFFIPSGSAKAFLLMPMIFSICSFASVHPQLAVLAFAYGDGFSNMILPTNAGLLLILGMTTVDYGKWVRWSLKIQLTLLAATIGILALAQFVVYA